MEIAKNKLVVLVYDVYHDIITSKLKMYVGNDFSCQVIIK